MCEHRRRRAWLIVLCMAAGPSTAAPPASRHDLVLGAGKFHEDCFRLDARQRLRYDFRMDRPGAFNIHYHKGRDVFYPVRSDRVSEQKGDFVAAIAEDYCLMWTAGKGGDTRLAYEFTVVQPGPAR